MHIAIENVSDKRSSNSERHEPISSTEGSICNWLVDYLGLWHINLCRLLKAKSIFMKIVLFQIIQFIISMQFKK